jgi:hypothetical protein
MENNQKPEPLPQHLQDYLAIAKRMYERMERDNSWPWVKEKENKSETF